MILHAASSSSFFLKSCEYYETPEVRVHYDMYPSCYMYNKERSHGFSSATKTRNTSLYIWKADHAPVL